MSWLELQRLATIWCIKSETKTLSGGKEDKQ